jgi:hypothetical protein
MVDETALLNALPLDSSPSITRLVHVVSPLKNLQTLAADADLSLGQVGFFAKILFNHSLFFRQVFQIASHLVLWGKATIIYPLCESNVYVLGPKTNTMVNSLLGEKFVEQFPGMSLSAIMAEFSLPSALGEHRDVLGLPHQQVWCLTGLSMHGAKDFLQAQEVQMVVWLLRHQLLLQLHTYVYLMPPTANAAASSRLTPQSGSNSEVELFVTGVKRTSSASDVASGKNESA